MAHAGETASSEEFRKLSKDFLLLSALIKDHKAKNIHQHQSSSGVGRSTVGKVSSHFSLPPRTTQLTSQANIKYVANNKEGGLGNEKVHIGDTSQRHKARSEDRKWKRTKNFQPVKHQVRMVHRKVPKIKEISFNEGRTGNMHTVTHLKSCNPFSKHSVAHVSRNSDWKRQHECGKTGTCKSSLEAKLQATKQAVIENRRKIEWLSKQAEKSQRNKQESLISKCPPPTCSDESFGRTSFSSGLREKSLPTEGYSQTDSKHTGTEKSQGTKFPTAKYVTCTKAHKSNPSLNYNQPCNPYGSMMVGGKASADFSVNVGKALPTAAKHDSLFSNAAALTSKPSATERLDSVRIAHEKSLKILQTAKSSPSSSEQLGDKDCEIARVQALSAYLEMLKEKETAKTAAKNSILLTEYSKGKNLVLDKKNAFSLPESVSKGLHVRRSNMAAKHCVGEGACSVLSSSQQGSRNHTPDKTEGDSARGTPSQKPTKDLAENNEVQQLKADIAILNAKIKLKHLENKRKGGGRKKSQYVWTPLSRQLSGGCPKSIIMTKKKKPLKRRTPQVVTGSVNHFVKINSSAKSGSLAPGNRSLVKTRTRYKVRKLYQKSTPKTTRSPSQEHRRVSGDKTVHGNKVRPGRNTSRLLRKNAKQYPVHTPLRSRFQTLSKLSHHDSRSAFNFKNKSHGHQYLPDKKWSFGRKHLWDRYEKPSFVTRRLQHMVEHSPMLFRSNPFLGRHRSLRRLDQIWHSPSIMAKRLYWQVKRPPLNIQTSSRRQPSADSGGRPSKKVMNVVNLNGVRYSRHGKSLKRLPGTSEVKRRKGVPPIPSRRLTNTKIAAQQVLQRSIFLSRTSKLRKAREPEYCMFFNRFGRCHKGTSCPYKHDPDKVAVCTRFLRGICNKATGFCPFSHKVSKDRMPVCRFFLKGVCTQVDCPYSHVKVSNTASICRDFVKGYCARGEKCTKKHLLECAEYSQKGSCPRKHCPLWHKKKQRLSGQGHKKGRIGSNSSAIKGHRRLATSPQGSSFIELKGEETSSTEVESGLENEVIQPLQIRPVFQTVTDK